LCNFHTIEPDLPAKPPGTQCRRLPVVLDETDIMLLEVKPQIFQRLQIELLDVVRTRLDKCLKLIVSTEAVGVLPIASISRTTARCHIGSRPWLGV
jgi:hypothetical protein